MSKSPMEQGTNPPTRILRLPEVLERTGLSRSTIYVRRAEGSFPQAVSLGGRAVGWVEAEVDDWVRERIAESRHEGAQAAGEDENEAEIAETGRRAGEARPVR